MASRSAAHVSAWVMVLIGWGLSSFGATPTVVSVVDLGGLGPHGAAAYGLNNLGQVVGQSWVDNYTTSHGFVYQNGAMQDLDAGRPSGSWPMSINDLGWVTGHTLLNGHDDAFIYRDGTFQDLGRLPGTFQSEALAINNAGDVVGFCPAVMPTHLPFLYHNGTMTDLSGSLLNANAINDSGVVAGQAPDFRPAVYQNGQVTEIPGIQYGYANAINRAGHLTGFYEPNSTTGSAFYWDGSTIRDLGLVNAIPTSINSSNQIVGYMESNSFYHGMHAFLWSDGQGIDLNTLMPSNLGYDLLQAWGINDSHQIIAFGSPPLGAPGIDDHAFLITLTPEPSSAMIVFAVGPILSRRRRR